MRKQISLLGLVFCLAGASAFAASPILGEVEIEAASKIERDAGVWLDGQYVGYVKNLSGKGKLVLVPGQHELLFRLIGFADVKSTVVVEPGERTEYRIAMHTANDLSYPEKEETARLRISVEPEDAAIFIDDTYVGHVDRFNGRRGVRLAPGTYRFTIALPGYHAFRTELTVRAHQDYEIKTELPVGRLDEQAAELVSKATVPAP